MPKLVRLGNVILSSILHSTERLHHSFFLAGDSWEGGTVMPIFLLSHLGLQLQIQSKWITL